MTILSSSASRREFLGRSAALTALTGTSFGTNLALMGSAAAQSTSDYKALVCIFLQGGNDQSNLIVPSTGADYLGYARARPRIALPATKLLAINPLNYDGPQLAFSAAMAPLGNLFAQQHCAIMANVGTLTVPITKAQWNRGTSSVAIPRQLFSHSDQQGAWQTGLPDRTSASGWLGRAGDLVAPVYNASSPVSVCVSLAGNNLIQTGNKTVQYQLTPGGTVALNYLDDMFGSPQAAAALKKLLTQSTSANLMEQQYSGIAARAISVESVLSKALGAVHVKTPFPDGPLGQQLEMVAKMIATRQSIGQGRQIFFVSSGGWDFHEDLPRQQALRLTDLSSALSAFYAATVELGVAQNVTSFTASDFGRALLSNGRGADHGWGSHHFVVGGAVKGGRVYGSFPTVAVGGPEDAGQGRLIPTTSVDEYAGTLASWFGVSPTDLPTVLPNIGRFAKPDLGFMSA